MSIAKVAISAASMYSAQGREELENSLAAATITNDNIGHRYVQQLCRLNFLYSFI